MVVNIKFWLTKGRVCHLFLLGHLGVALVDDSVVRSTHLEGKNIYQIHQQPSYTCSFSLCAIILNLIWKKNNFNFEKCAFFLVKIINRFICKHRSIWAAQRAAKMLIYCVKLDHCIWLTTVLWIFITLIYQAALDTGTSFSQRLSKISSFRVKMGTWEYSRKWSSNL